MTARAQLQAAERDDATTRALLERAEQADADLRKFYRETLPSSVEGARRMSYAKLASLADHHGLVIERRSYDRDTGYRGRLHKLKINMALSGEYRDGCGHKPGEAIERLLMFVKKFPTNTQMLKEIPG